MSSSHVRHDLPSSQQITRNPHNDTSTQERSIKNNSSSTQRALHFIHSKSSTQRNENQAFAAAQSQNAYDDNQYSQAHQAPDHHHSRSKEKNLHNLSIRQAQEIESLEQKLNRNKNVMKMLEEHKQLRKSSKKSREQLQQEENREQDAGDLPNSVSYAKMF